MKPETSNTIPWAKIIKEYNAAPSYAKGHICHASSTFRKLWEKNKFRLEIVEKAKSFIKSYKDKTIHVDGVSFNSASVLFLKNNVKGRPFLSLNCKPLKKVRKDFLEYMVRETQS